MAEDLNKKAYEAVELARKTGKIRKGTNETTKAIEKGIAKLVLVAKDVNPPEITMHISPLCKERKVTVIEVPSKEELGAAAGLQLGCASVAIVTEGDSKKLIQEITSLINQK